MAPVTSFTPMCVVSGGGPSACDDKALSLKALCRPTPRVPAMWVQLVAGSVFLVYAQEFMLDYAVEAAGGLRTENGAAEDVAWACVGAVACSVLCLIGGRPALKRRAADKVGSAPIKRPPSAARTASSPSPKASIVQDVGSGLAAAAEPAGAKDVTGRGRRSPGPRTLPSAQATAARTSGSPCSAGSSAEEAGPELELGGFRSKVSSFNMAIHASAKKQDIAQSEYWFQKMRDCGIEPNLATYNCMMNAYIKGGKTEDAEICMTSMQEAGIKATIVTYATLIHGRAKRGDTAAAVRWLEISLENDLEPNIFCYNSLISAFAYHGDIKGAEHWYEEAAAQGLVGTVATFSTLVDACAKRGLLHRAEHWMDVMVERGITPNVVSYGSIIDACAKSSCPGRAEEWHHKMLEQGVTPNMYTFSALVNSCAKAGDIASAEKYLESMGSFGLVAEVIIYNGILDACAKASDCARAMRIFKQMKARKVRPNLVAYASLARPFAHAGDWRAVEELEGEMRGDGLSPNDYFLYARLVSCAKAKPRQAKRAEDAFLAARAAGVPANVRVTDALMRAIGRARARQLLDPKPEC